MERKKLTNKRKIGSIYEQKAGKYLEAQGYRVLEYNYHCRQGEIDLIVMDGSTLVFVEVKYRKSNSMISSLEAVNYHKQCKISKVATYYVYSKNYFNQACRFDVIGFDGELITHVKDAFEYR